MYSSKGCLDRLFGQIDKHQCVGHNKPPLSDSTNIPWKSVTFKHSADFSQPTGWWMQSEHTVFGLVPMEDFLLEIQRGEIQELTGRAFVSFQGKGALVGNKQNLSFNIY